MPDTNQYGFDHVLIMAKSNPSGTSGLALVFWMSKKKVDLGRNGKEVGEGDGKLGDRKI